MSCSTTTSQPEWLRTSWGKLPTETSELPLVTLTPPPPAPLGQRRGCTLRWGHIPIILTRQNNAAIHKCSQATNFPPLTWASSLIRLMRVSHAFQTDLQSARHSSEGRINILNLLWPWCQPHMLVLRVPCFSFTGGAWPLRPWMHITTQRRMRWFCLQESFRLRFTVVPGLSTSSASHFRLKQSCWMDFY